MSFPAIMVLLVAITGLIWLVDRFWLAPKRKVNDNEPAIVEYAKSFFPILLLVLVIRSFIAEPFRIPSESMLPTLHVGDFILVNKFSYGVRLPVINTKILDTGSPERGDVMVFRYPKQPEIDYIKRVIGLPGDKVGYFNKTLYLNGQEVKTELVDKPSEMLGTIAPRVQLKHEFLNSDPHEIFLDPQRQSMEGEVTVPEGHYFVMGDNRDNSNDSRVWGTVPEENLVGKAFFVWMSWDWNQGGLVWSRVGSSIN
ncbi:signal peptidase I [uncultured Methylophaga sp.]|uniref:signal peptidase I n=1 Tax=uncultured Methylophaga sp. TaxID=285271 RepID=UPI0026232F94|nr:signal peptidase I [uncultured Methylophaga sp.]